MTLSKQASKLTLPASKEYSTVLEFLKHKFPHVPTKEWEERILNNKVHWKNGQEITIDTPYQANKTLLYYREVSQEPKIPEEETIIFQNNHFLIAHKPHFLPVMPGGQFVNECLQARLISKTGISELQAVHRLDRDTAGLVLFSTNADTRHQYHQLFSDRTITKTYQAIAQTHSSQPLTGKAWHIKNYLKRSNPKFLFEAAPSEETGQYAESQIECLSDDGSLGLFELKPITGRTHQLRVHMQSIGYPILNDRFYPTLQDKQDDDYSKPLKLLAHKLSFNDPISGKDLSFESPHTFEVKLVNNL